MRLAPGSEFTFPERLASSLSCWVALIVSRAVGKTDLSELSND